MNRILRFGIMLCLTLPLSQCQNKKPAQDGQNASIEADETEASGSSEESNASPTQAETDQSNEDALKGSLNYIISGQSTMLSLFGASGGGEWLRFTDVREKFTEPIEFRFFTVEGFSESRTLGPDILEYDEYCDCPLIFLEKPRYEDFYVGITGDWDPVPDDINLEPMDTEYSEELGLAYLIDKGLGDPVLSIDEVIEVDIDGDDKTDALIDLFHGETAQTFGSASGSYSVILMISDVRGSREVIPVKSKIYTRDGENESDQVNNNSITFVADFNGDGIYEIVIYDSYYEGGGEVIFTMKNGEFARALRCFCGS